MSKSCFNTSASSCNRPLFLAKLLLSANSKVLSCLIDSGAGANLIDEEMAGQLYIKWVLLSKTVPARAVDCHLLGMVTYQKELIRLRMSGNPIFSSPHIPLILGSSLAALSQCNVAIQGWSSFCHHLCLKQAVAQQQLWQ